MRAVFATLLAALLSLSIAACSASASKDGPPGTDTSGPDGAIGFGDTSGDAGGIDDDAACAAATYDGQRVPADLLILFDRSASMSDPTTDGGTDEKWTYAVEAIDQALTTSDDSLPVGLLVFPEGKFNDTGLLGCEINPNTPTCQALLADSGCKDIATTPNVAVAPLSTSRAQIKTFLDAATPDGSNTPTRWALKNAWTIMQSLKTDGDRYVVLVTDGIPTEHQPAQSVGPITIPESAIECADLATIEGETSTAAAAAPPVKTFVIGVPGSEGNPQFLSQEAVDGQTSKPGCSVAAGNCHYQIGGANFTADLQAALTEIAGRIATCIFTVPTGTDVNPALVNVELSNGGSTTELDKDPSHGDGWDYTDASQSRIEVYGPSCDAIKAGAGASVKILLGCKTHVR